MRLALLTSLSPSLPVSLPPTPLAHSFEASCHQRGHVSIARVTQHSSTGSEFMKLVSDSTEVTTWYRLKSVCQNGLNYLDHKMVKRAFQMSSLLVTSFLHTESTGLLYITLHVSCWQTSLSKATLGLLFPRAPWISA